MHTYEVRPRKDQRGADLISDMLPFGRLWYGEPSASEAIIFSKRPVAAQSIPKAHQFQGLSLSSESSPLCLPPVAINPDNQIATIIMTPMTPAETFMFMLDCPGAAGPVSCGGVQPLWHAATHAPRLSRGRSAQSPTQSEKHCSSLLGVLGPDPLVGRSPLRWCLWDRPKRALNLKG